MLASADDSRRVIHGRGNGSEHQDDMGPDYENGISAATQGACSILSSQEYRSSILTSISSIDRPEVSGIHRHSARKTAIFMAP